MAEVSNEKCGREKREEDRGRKLEEKNWKRLSRI